MARVLLLSPYHGGSHQAFADGLIKHSSHRIDLLTLPPRFWKWRMRGAGMLLASRARKRRQPWDVVMASDMMNLAEFRALSGLADRPHLLYLHENQLDYPLPENDRADLHYGFINLASAQAAERLVFNSRTHRDAFLAAIPRHLSAMPDCKLPDPVPGLRRRGRVLPVGCELHWLRRHAAGAGDGGPPVILWNHRWEFDKDPDTFFAVVDSLAESGLEFRLILAGECSQVKPKAFLAARQRHKSRILSYGYVPSRQDYARLLGRADIVVSTAVQENFGVSVVEAMACGAWPLLPHRLAYPEVLPAPWHEDCLYTGAEDLKARLTRLLKGTLPAASRRDELGRRMLRYDWASLIGSYDDMVSGLLAQPATGDH
jgi:glycosyltransferase involved in cell wall biosynthesis